MKTKLLLLNALLAGMFILGAAELYRQVVEADGRYDRLQAFADPKQPPEFPSPEDPTPTRATNFMPVVERLLFAEDRNAIVVVETEEVEAAKRPPLPLLSGLIDFGDGPSALMTARADQAAKWIAVGGKIGDFVFEGVEGEEVKLSWNEESFAVAKAELNKAPQAPQAKTRVRGGPRGGQAAAGAAAAPTNLAGGGPASLFGPEIRPGVHSLVPGDDSPAGTERDGFIKVIRQNPFGTTGWWQKKE